MQRNLILSTLFFIGIIFLLPAQEIKGIATYIYKMRDIKPIMDGPELSKELNDQYLKAMKEAFEKEYSLNFNAHESVFSEVPKLADPNPKNSFVKISVSGIDEVRYNNFKKNETISEKTFLGKEFLVTDSIRPRNWKLINETKMIGEYTCFKATYGDTITEAKTSISDGVVKVSEQEKPITITAWYTPQIPVKHGPRNYYGLPGLILELNNETEIFLCNKIILNPSKGVTIKKPTTGKKVTAEEYLTIQEKKLKENDEDFNGKGNITTFKTKG